MASFGSFALAEQRAYLKRADGTWINAHAERDILGVLGVRVQRKMAANAGHGGWVSIQDDATV